MKYEIQVWNLEKLLELIEKKEIDLQPSYQRNPIWTARAQRKLIETILLGHPIPNFFVRIRGDGHFEMVDGQQRARTVFAYWTNQLLDIDNLTWERRLQISNYSQSVKDQFLKYRITVVIISELAPSENIEQFYALVNSSGLRLNRPELRKASYYNTRFLALLLELTECEELAGLRIFEINAATRMHDFELVSEVVATLKFGIFDKKEKVDQLYEDDINAGEADALRAAFHRVLITLKELDAVQPLRRTRFRQRGDFYSLFYFLHILRDITTSERNYLFQVLLKIAPHIRPSNMDCVPLQSYAYYCTTQSNSKRSRTERHRILCEILANEVDRPTESQEQIMDYFAFQDRKLVSIGPYFTVDFKSIKDPRQLELEFDAFFKDEV